MRGVLAAATAALMFTRLGEAKRARSAQVVAAISRESDIEAVRRAGIHAQRVAMVASLWAAETAGQCLLAPNYGPAIDFGRVTHIIPRAATPVQASGARALWAKMRAAGYQFGEEPIAVDRLAKPARGAVNVRMLKQAAANGSAQPERKVA